MSTSATPAILDHTDERRPSCDHAAFWLSLATIVFVSLSLWGAITSEGFVEADGCTHYMYARFAVERPYLLLDVWGRPLATGLHALPAYFFGRMGVRAISLVLALACAAVTYRIAKVQRYRLASAAVIFLFAQPLFYLHSFAELTELPFALLVICGLWAYQERRWFWMTVLIALTPLGRPEGFGFMLLAGFALVCHRKSYWVALLPLPLLFWSWLGWVHSRPLGADGIVVPMQWWQWLLKNWPYEAQSNYGRGPIWHYLHDLPVIVGPLLAPGALVGGWWCLKHGKLFGTNHRARCDVVIAAVPLGILVVHSIFWALGKFSGGEVRYHLIVGPFWALTVARGYEVICDLVPIRRPLLAAAVLAILPLGVNRMYRVLPIHLSPGEQIAKQVAERYQADPALRRQYPRVTTPVQMVYYFLDVASTDYDRVGLWRRDQITDPQPGQLLVYEPILATYNSDKGMIVPRELIEEAGWVLDREYENGWATFLSPVQADGTATKRVE